jgi:hypothetical protein
MNPEFDDQAQHRSTPAVDTNAPRRRFAGPGGRSPRTIAVTSHLP